MEGRTLVLMGRTGNGKSSNGNSILGRNAFKSLWSLISVTKECKSEPRTWKDGRMLNVVDTPGLFDTNARKEDIDREIVKCINLANDGVHGFLLVFSIGKRFTEEEAIVIDNLEMLFGPTIVNYMVIVFTGGDKLEKRCMTLEQYTESCPPNLKRVLNRCNSRMVVFNNKSSSETIKENQISKLLEQVDCIIADNGNHPYSNELFTKAQGMASQLFYIRDKEKVYVEQIKQLNEMMEQNTRAVEEKMRGVTVELEKQVESARSARMKAENEALSFKQNLDAQVANLTKQLEEEKKKNELINAAKKCPLCSFL